MKMNPKLRNTLEGVKFGADTINALIPIIRIIAGLAGVAVLLLFINAQFDRRSNIEDYIAAAEQFRNDAEQAIAFSDSLKLEIANIEIAAHQSMERANELSLKTATLQNERGRLRGELTDMTTSANIDYENVYAVSAELISVQDSIIDTQSSEILDLRNVIDLKDETIFLLTQSRDSLQFVLSNPPPVPTNPNKFLGISLPSRRASFIAGAVTATVAIIVITK